MSANTFNTEKIKIAVAARDLGLHFHGPATYARGLIQGLIDTNPGYEIYVYYSTERALGFFPSVHERVLKSSNKLIWDNVLFPLAVKKETISVTLFPKGTIPFLFFGKSIPIILDLGYFYPKLNAYRILNTYYMRAIFKHTAKKAAGIFTISESTRQDVIKHLRVSKEKVLTIYGDCSSEFRMVKNKKKLSSVVDKYQLKLPFIFVPISSISPRKNLDRLLDAFLRIKEDIPHHLYITGAITWNSQEVLNRLSKPAIRNRVHRLKFLPIQDMVSFYNLADFTVYPSLFEGLGLPVLEAFNCGSPVLTTIHTSLPEVAGDAAVLVDGYNFEEFAQGILKLAQEPQTRAVLRKKGLAQAQDFSWDKTSKLVYQWLEQNI